MKIILVEDIYNLGYGGDVVTVADGFARNYLIPQKKAILATPYNLKKVENIKNKAEEERLERENKYKAICYKMEDMELIFERKADDNGHLFGSVSEQDIADKLQAEGLEVHKTHVKLEKHLKELGETEVLIAFTNDITINIKVNVVEEAVQVEEDNEEQIENTEE